MANWIKSSRSMGGNGNECVEVATDFAPGLVGLRDSKDDHTAETGPVLTLDAAGYAGFLSAVQAGRFDLS